MALCRASNRLGFIHVGQNINVKCVDERAGRESECSLLTVALGITLSHISLFDYSYNSSTDNSFRTYQAFVYVSVG